MKPLAASIFGLGDMELFFVCCALAFYGLVIWAIIDLFSNRDLEIVPKLLWLAIILFFPIFGTLIYLYYGRSAKHLSDNR